MGFIAVGIFALLSCSMCGVHMVAGARVKHRSRNTDDKTSARGTSDLAPEIQAENVTSAEETHEINETQNEEAQQEETTDLRKDPAALTKALQVALEAIKSERAIVCPARVQDIPEDESKIDCCEVAVKQTIPAQKETGTDVIPAPTETMELHFKIPASGKLIKVRLIDGEVEYIEPSPCGELEDEATEENHPVHVRDRSDTVLDAVALIESRLGKRCDTHFGVYTLIKKVHWATVRIVEGLSVRLVAEFEKGTLHNIEVNFDIDGHSQIIWPQLKNSTDPCDMFHQSTLDRAILSDIVAMSDEGLSASPAPATNTSVYAYSALQYAGGHLAALDEAVPLASMAELHDLLHSNTSKAPSKYDPRKTHPKCFPNSIALRQGSCGSCWAFAATGAVGDRHCIANPASMIDSASGWRYTLSVQQILSCRRVNGCDGGHAYWVFDDMIHKGMKLNYARDYPYQSRCWQDTDGVTEDFGNFNCWTMKSMSDDNPKKPCACVAQHKRLTRQPSCDRSKQSSGEFTIEKYKRLPKPGSFKGFYGDMGYWTNAEVEQLIQNELYKNGPVYASFAVYADFQRFVRYRGGQAVYRSQSTDLTGYHAVVMIGYGVERSTKFWTLRNSWGPDWGDSGHYRHIRGINDCGIEEGINVPQVAVVQRVTELKLSGETVKVSTNGFWKKTKVWTLNIKCNAPCKPVFAVLPDVDVAAHFQNDDSSSKCCCDRVHFRPGKCLWVPNRDLSSDTWGYKDCGAYNFGRGKVQTTEYNVASCGEEMFAGNSSAKAMQLEFKNVRDNTLQVKIDLTANPSLVGMKRLLVKAKSSSLGNGDIEVEQLYYAPIYSSSPLMKLFTIFGVEWAIERKNEPYKIRGYLGFDDWKLREKFMLRVTARCSEKCEGSAAFQSLDAYSKYSKARAALKSEASESGTTLTWVAYVGDCPPGQQTIAVTAWSVADRSKTSQEISVDIPTEGKGGLRLPLRH